ncbi:uncharacterized protein N7484_009819 [Penicillium longicatenatum]|uniref:uncharacterized protein n=1 Tax=Penicillium longicatenatum TaxID=1561947 RepID=UPI002548EA91|nr:uncharacterized protein N7484_009819 [Penicillium longicatenatum]KAJ5636506.1 hypothetical protein N7484_009819 [Penicillium longicatenatum]
MSDGTTVNSSEPITLLCMTQLAGVEFGRGKEGGELIVGEDISDLRRGLDSDETELPASDL